MSSSLFFLLQKFPFSDSSIIAKGFDSEFGKISFILKGSKRLKSTNKLDYFNLYQINFNFSSKKQLQNLRQVSVEDEYKNIKENFSRQSLASVILEIYLRYLQDLEKSPSLFHYLVDTLDTINLSKIKNHDFPMILSSFLLGFLSFLGLSPQLDVCVQCQKKFWKNILFVFELGGLMCSDCFYQAKGKFKFERLSTLDVLTLQRLKKNHFRAVYDSLKKGLFLEQLLINFLNYKMETSIYIRSLETYRSMVHHL